MGGGHPSLNKKHPLCGICFRNTPIRPEAVIRYRNHAPPFCSRPRVYNNAAIIAAPVRTWFNIVHRSR